MKTQQHTCMPTSWSQYFWFNKICNFPRHWIVKILPEGLVLHYTTLQILASAYLHFTQLSVRFYIIISQTFSVWFMSGEYPDLFRTGIPFYSRNVLVLLEILQGRWSCIKIYPFCGTQLIHISLYFAAITIDAIVMFGTNRMNHAMCIQTTIK